MRDLFLDEEQARNPDTPAPVLAKLVRHPSPKVRKLAAQNPNTPPELLLGMIHEYAGEVFANPAFALLQLERVNLWRELNEKDLLAFLRVEGFPSSLVALIAADPRQPVREFLANNPLTPEAVLARLAHDASPPVREKLAENLALPRHVAAHLLGDPEAPVRARVVQRGLVRDLAELLRQAERETYFQRDGRLLGPHELLPLLACGVYVQRVVARHPGADAEIMARLAASPYWEVRAELAHRADTPPALLRSLSQDPHWFIRQLTLLRIF